MHKYSAFLTPVLTGFLLAGCGTSPAPSSAAPKEQTLLQDQRKTVARIELSAPTTLLTRPGQTVRLNATAYDSQGRRLKGKLGLAWTSSAPGVISVDAEGRAVAQQPLGSATVTVSIGALRSNPLVLTVARVAENVVLIDTEQITAAPAPVSGAPMDALTGARFTLGLAGPTPAPGQVLLSTGALPVAGRVLAAQPGVSGTTVTLETVPLTALYRDLSVSQQVTVDAASLVPLTGTQAPQSVRRQPDGSVTLTYRLPDQRAGGSALTPQSTAMPGDDLIPGPFTKTEFEVGPFKCSSTLDTLLSGDLLSIKLDSKLDLDLNATITNGELQAFAAQLNGEVMGTVTGGLNFDLGVQGKLKCRAVVARLPIPLTGPLAAVVVPTVPLGLGFALEGKLKLGKVQFALEGKVGAKLKAGFAYNAATGAVTGEHDLTPVNTLTPLVKLLGPADALRLEGALGVQASAGLDFTVFPWLLAGAPNFQALDLAFGPKLEGNLAPVAAQAVANDYASSYALKLAGTLAPGDSVTALLGVLGTRNQVKVFNVAPTQEVTLARSPNGTITGAASATVDKPMDITVELNPSNVTFMPGVYNIEQVQLYRDRNGTLELMDHQAATDGQVRFVFPWTPGPFEAGQTALFRAFVVSRRVSGVPLELDNDPKLAVSVRLADAPPPPPPPPPGQGWTGNVTYRWSGSHTYASTNAEGTKTVGGGTASGALTCTYHGSDADGEGSASWTFDDVATNWAEETTHYESEPFERRDARLESHVSRTQPTVASGGLPYFSLDSSQLTTRVVAKYVFRGQPYYDVDYTRPLALDGRCDDFSSAWDTNPDPDVISISQVIPPRHAPPHEGYTETLEVNLVRR